MSVLQKGYPSPCGVHVHCTWFSCAHPRELWSCSDILLFTHRSLHSEVVPSDRFSDGKSLSQVFGYFWDGRTLFPSCFQKDTALSCSSRPVGGGGAHLTALLGAQWWERSGQTLFCGPQTLMFLKMLINGIYTPQNCSNPLPAFIVFKYFFSFPFIF